MKYLFLKLDMELNLSYKSEDYFNISISQQNKNIFKNLNNIEKGDEINNEEIKKAIREEIKNINDKALEGIMREDYYDIKMYKNDKNINNNNDQNKNQKYDYSIEILCKDKVREDIESKISSCMEKEKILINKQNEFKKICDSIEIDEKLLEKKLTSLAEMDTEEYNKIIDEIIPKILDYDNFIKEAKKVEDRLIKYRESSIFALCFKIYLKKISKIIVYLANKSIIFLNNEKLFKFCCNFFQKIIKKISDDIYESIILKISNNEIYKSHKEIYNQKFNYYKEVCYLFPILKYFDNEQEKEIYEINKDINLKLNEYQYDIIARVDSQIPRRNALNITLEYFKKFSNVEEAYAMALRRSLLIYQKYKIYLTNFKNGAYLYE